MQKVLSYLLLFVYATVMLKPIMPSVADGFAHIANYREHVATVHVENGKYHVHNEYMDAAKKSQKDDDKNITAKSSVTSEHFFASEQLIIIYPFHQGYYSKYLHPIFILPYFSLPLRPPIC